jgi:amino acid transporter
LRELVIYGIVLIQPTAPMPVYGVVCQQARGHVVTTILIGMVAMLFTAISYGRMAAAYPSAGSAYTYVGRELHPALGYLTGWALIFDYVMNPVICVIWCSKAAMNFAPGVPFAAWAVSFAALFTLLNLRGIRASARTNEWIAAGLGLVIILFFLAAARTILGEPGLSAGRFVRPFYDPATFSWRAVSTGTAIAMLTYIGFDGISTLSEEAHDPRCHILLATVLTCLVTGGLAAAQVYAAQLVWPGYRDFPDVDTAFVHVAGRAGGPALFVAVNLALLVATIGSGAGSHLAAGRLLYGMGRDDAIPRRFFGALDPRTRIPRNNILLVGGLALLGALAVSYQLGAELLNFGAFIGFMGVNLAAFMRYYVRGDRRSFLDLAPPLLGFVVCAYIWWSLRWPAKLAGLAWLAAGLLYGAWKTGGFRRQIEFAAPDETDPGPPSAQPASPVIAPDGDEVVEGVSSP